MRTTVTLDDALMADARELTGIKENSRVIQEAVRFLVERKAAHRLALLGGSDPGAKAPPRRRWPPERS